jgi:hypothetical protein
MRQVHLVGSVPLASARDVFCRVSEALGARAPRIPDGETGARSLWIMSQVDWLRQNDRLFEEKPKPNAVGIPVPTFSVREPAVALTLPAVGYAKAAIDSYATFAALKSDGTIAKDSRFLVALATPIALPSTFIVAEHQQMFFEANVDVITSELAEILRVIPLSEVAIQFDVCVEILILEGVRTSGFGAGREFMMQQLVNLIDSVVEPAQAGIHLCYGDLGHRHSIEPRDLGLCVALANDAVAGTHRSLNWVHMPVPRSRDDASYFQPLETLALSEKVDLFLGLLHFTDGIEGARRRIAAASQFKTRFGIATECGFGRRSPETIRPLLDLHRIVADDVA